MSLWPFCPQPNLKQSNTCYNRRRTITWVWVFWRTRSQSDWSCSKAVAPVWFFFLTSHYGRFNSKLTLRTDTNWWHNSYVSICQCIICNYWDLFHSKFQQSHKKSIQLVLTLTPKAWRCEKWVVAYLSDSASSCFLLELCCSFRGSNMEESVATAGKTKAPATCDLANSVIWQKTKYWSNIWCGESNTGYCAFLLCIYCYFFTVTQQSISFCYEMKTEAVSQAEQKAVITNLLDVSGSIDCVLCCLSLLTHHLSSCLLEAFQGFFVICCQVFLQFNMSLEKNHTFRKKTIMPYNSKGQHWLFERILLVRGDQLINCLCVCDFTLATLCLFSSSCSCVSRASLSALIFNS